MSQKSSLLENSLSRQRNVLEGEGEGEFTNLKIIQSSHTTCFDSCFTKLDIRENFWNTLIIRLCVRIKKCMLF